jgi:hypothetical protein
VERGQENKEKESRAANLPWKRLYTLKEAAVFLGRSEWGMRELIWSGKVPVVREQGGRKIFLDISDLDQFINANKSVYR